MRVPLTPLSACFQPIEEKAFFIFGQGRRQHFAASHVMDGRWPAARKDDGSTRARANLAFRRSLRRWGNMGPLSFMAGVESVHAPGGLRQGRDMKRSGWTKAR